MPIKLQQGCEMKAGVSDHTEVHYQWSISVPGSGPPLSLLAPGKLYISKLSILRRSHSGSGISIFSGFSNPVKNLARESPESSGFPQPFYFFQRDNKSCYRGCCGPQDRIRKGRIRSWVSLNDGSRSVFEPFSTSESSRSLCGWLSEYELFVFVLADVMSSFSTQILDISVSVLQHVSECGNSR